LSEKEKTNKRSSRRNRDFKKGVCHINEKITSKEQYEIVDRLSEHHSKRKVMKILNIK
jgi:hypothetical protein